MILSPKVSTLLHLVSRSSGVVGFGSRNFLIALLIVIVGPSLILRGLVAVEVLEEGVNLCEG